MIQQFACFFTVTMKNTRFLSLSKAIKLAKKLEAVEENFNRTQLTSSLTQLSSVSTNCSYSTTPFIVSEKIMCKIKKGRISPMLNSLSIKKNNFCLSQDRMYSKSLIKLLKKLCTKNIKNSSKKRRKNNKKYSELHDICLNKIKGQIKFMKKCKICKNRYKIISKEKYGKNNFLNSDKQNLIENKGKMVKLEAKETEKKKFNLDTTFLKPDLNLLKKPKQKCSKQPNLQHLNTTKESNLEKKSESEIIINMTDLNPKYTSKEKEEDRLLDTFRRIELWKQCGTPWINELHELYQPNVTFPPQNILIESSICGSLKKTNISTQTIWKSPDLSPVENISRLKNK